jgi:hypothetical protein
VLPRDPAHLCRRELGLAAEQRHLPAHAAYPLGNLIVEDEGDTDGFEFVAHVRSFRGLSAVAARTAWRSALSGARKGAGAQLHIAAIAPDESVIDDPHC